MISPNNRKEFERHLNILIESARNNKLKLPPSRKLMNGLLSAKYTPNSRINFLTIDESTRLLANSLANFDRPEFKSRKDAEQ